jgi:hypothetical protein
LNDRLVAAQVVNYTDKSIVKYWKFLAKDCVKGRNSNAGNVIHVLTPLSEGRMFNCGQHCLAGDKSCSQSVRRISHEPRECPVPGYFLKPAMIQMVAGTDNEQAVRYRGGSRPTIDRCHACAFAHAAY